MGSGTKFRNWESFNDVALERKNTMKEGNAEEEDSQCCGNPRVFFDDVRAEKICRNCGTVLKEREPIASLSTNQFKARNQNGNTRKKYSKKNLSRDLQRALKLDRRTYDEKRIIRGIKEIKRIGSIREIPEQLQQHAIELFKKTMERVKNKFISPLAAICLYHFCNSNGYPIEMEELMKDYKCSMKLIRNYYWKIVRMFGLKMTRKTAVIYLPKTISELSLSSEVERIASKLIRKYEQSKPCHSNSYKGIAAGAIYLVCTMKRLRITQKEISNQLNVSEITLRTRYAELKSVFKKFFL